MSRVHYPGLPSHPDHAIATEQMTGFGGVVSFEVRLHFRVPCYLGKVKITLKAQPGGTPFQEWNVKVRCLRTRLDIQFSRQLLSHRACQALEQSSAGARAGLKWRTRSCQLMSREGCQ